MPVRLASRTLRVDRDLRARCQIWRRSRIIDNIARGAADPPRSSRAFEQLGHFVLHRFQLIELQARVRHNENVSSGAVLIY